jgi:outer membrane protein assembly factor BamB
MRRFLGLLVVVGLAWSQSAFAGDWPAFRGPHGDGFSEEKGAPTTWSATENVKWKVALPDEGNGSPIVVGDRVFVTCAQEKGAKRGLYCFDRTDGTLKWSKIIDFGRVEPTHGTNPYCSPTPTSDGKNVVVWHGSAGLYCYDLAGKELWRRTDLGEFVHTWGYAASPIIYKNTVIQNCAPGAKMFLAAFNLATGRDVWRTDEPSTGPDGKPNKGTMGTWSTPIVTKIDGQEQVVVFQPNRVVGYRPTNGEIVWACEIKNQKGALAYSSPMISDGLCVAQGGYSGGGAAFKVGGRGDLSAGILWHKPTNPQSIGTGVIIDGKLYIPDAGPGTFRCIDVKTGDVKWTERAGTFWGSIVMAEGLAYCTSQDGATYVFRPNPEKFDLVAKNELKEHSNSTPAISNGQIFIRTFDNLWCIEAKK